MGPLRVNIRRDLARCLPTEYLHRACGASSTGSGALGAALAKAASETSTPSSTQETPHPIARLVMRQEKHTGGHGTRLILNALVGSELIAAMHPLQDKSITLSALSTLPRGSSTAPAFGEGGGLVFSEFEGKAEGGDGSAGGKGVPQGSVIESSDTEQQSSQWALHSYLIKLAKPEEARDLLEGIERARHLLVQASTPGELQVVKN